MTLTIDKVRYRNYGPFEDVTARFGRPGLTGIEGIIEWQPGSNSNGSGKSKLIGGLAWCAFGRDMAANYKGDDVIRIGSKGGTCVDMELIGTDQPDVRIERYRKWTKDGKKNHVYLFIGGEDVTRGTDDETQAAIEHVLGMDFRTFCTSVAFGANEDVKSFFAATDTDRKQILDRILGMGIYADAERKAKLRAALLESVLLPLRDQQSRFAGALEAKRGTLVDLQESEDPDELEFKLSLAKLARKRVDSFIDKAAYLCDDANAEWRREARADVLLRDEHELAAAALRGEHVKATNAHAEAVRQFDQEARDRARDGKTAAREIDRIDAQLQKADALEGSECPTCHQPVGAGALVVARADLNSAREEQEGLFALASEAGAAARESEDALQAPPAFVAGSMFVPNPEVQVKQDAVDGRESAHRQLQARGRVLESEERAAAALYDRATAQVTKLEREIERLSAEIEEVGLVVGEKEQALARVQFWVEAFGNRGLKSYLIEAEVPLISNRATSYAQRLFGEGTIVRLQATTTLKGGGEREKLSIEAKIPGCCSTYAGASTGQKKRLDLALLLAFRDVIAARSQGAIRQFFADELFDGLDVPGTEKVIELLREISADCPVTLVTHNDAMKSSVDQTITVRHMAKYLATVDDDGFVSFVPLSPKARRQRATT